VAKNYEPCVNNHGFVWTCQRCGSAVNDREVHDEWHKVLRLAIVNAAFGGQSARTGDFSA